MDENLYKLRLLLMEQSEWPLLYYFKFIIPNEKEKIEMVKLLFSDPSKITFNASRDINYISISYKQYMSDVDSIIEIYRKAGLIEGLMAL